MSKLDPDLTFIMFCKGHIPPSQYRSVFPPLFIWKTEHQDFSHQTASDIMLSQDHYNYLVSEHNFQLDSVSGILLFKKDTILPSVFEHLTRERYLENSSSSKIVVIKSIINFACGYFGMNANRQKNASKKNGL
jgi:hypothetical protein